MTVTEINDTAMFAQVHALEGIVAGTRRERDDANADRARLLRVNIDLTSQVDGLRSRVDELVRERDDLWREVVRHRRAAAAYAALEAVLPAPARRELTGWEQVSATVLGLAVIGVVCGVVVHTPWMWVTAAVVGIVSGATLLLASHAPDPRQPFDCVQAEAVDRG